MPIQQHELYDVETANYEPESIVDNQLVVRLQKEEFLESAVASAKRSQRVGGDFFSEQQQGSWMTSSRSSTMPSTKSADPFLWMGFKIPKIEFDARVANRPIAVVQQWEGVVSAISDEEFTARLHDITDPTNPAEEGDFLIEDLNESSRSLLKKGAVFRWITGYKGGKTSTRFRVSQITFRQLPAWTASELAEADSKANDLVAGIEWV